MTRKEVPIETANEWWCVSQHAAVEHRGAGMGKVYVYHSRSVEPGPDTIEAIFTWTAPTKKGKDAAIRPQGVTEPTRDAKDRAVRALAMSPWGELCFGYRLDEKDLADPPPLPDALTPEQIGDMTLDEYKAKYGGLPDTPPLSDRGLTPESERIIAAAAELGRRESMEPLAEVWDKTLPPGSRGPMPTQAEREQEHREWVQSQQRVRSPFYSELVDRLERASITLEAMCEVEPERADHLRSKAEGVRLALSYMQEMQQR